MRADKTSRYQLSFSFLGQFISVNQPQTLKAVHPQPFSKSEPCGKGQCRRNSAGRFFKLPWPSLLPGGLSSLDMTAV